MSTLRRLWAAVWLQWQLVRARLRRGRGGVADDFRLPGAELPVEGVDYDSDELPADLAARLETSRMAIRDRARSAAGRPSARSRRRRTASLAAVAVLGVGAFGAGATALVTGSTGVPAVDRLLGQEAAERAEEGKDGPALSRGSLTPEPDTDSTVLELPFDAGGASRRVVSTSYRDKDGRLCTVTSTADVDAETPRAGIGCLALSPLGRQLAERRVIVADVKAAETVVLDGYVTPEVEQLELTGALTGPLVVRLSKPWQPAGADGPTLRSFLAVDPDGDGDQGSGQGGSLGAIDLRGYTIRARLASGESIGVEPTSP